MKGLRRFIAPFAPDQSGAAAVLCELGGMILILDAGGCAGNICGFDEPRWFDSRSAIFSAGLRDMDAILGRDALLVEKVEKACRRIRADFVALIGTPVPAVIATDYRALKRMIEKKTGLPVLAIETDGTGTYEKGAKKAWLELMKTFAGEGTHTEEALCQIKEDHSGSPCQIEDTRSEGGPCQIEGFDWEDRGSETLPIGLIGLSPLEFGNYGEESGHPGLVSYGMGDGIDKIRKAGQNRMNYIVSPSGLAAARYLKETFGTPFAPWCPPSFVKEGEMFLDKIEEYRCDLAGSGTGGEGKDSGRPKILIVHQQFYANDLRDAIEEKWDADITVASWFGMEKEWMRDGDYLLKEEDEWIEKVSAEDYDLILADPVFRRACKKIRARWYDLPHFAVSGKRED